MKNNKTIICIIIWMICLIVLTTIALTGTPGKDLANRFGLVIIVGIGIDLIMILILYNNQGKMRINTKVKKTEKAIYYREPPFNYSPVIITYLENLKIEFKKDFIAEIAFLINKKILKLEKINNEYYISFYLREGEKSTVVGNNSKTERITLNSQFAILKNMPREGKIKLKDLVKKLEKNKYDIEAAYEKDCIDLGYLEKGNRIEKIKSKKLYMIITILLIPTIVILFKIMVKFGIVEMIGSAFLIWIISLAYSVPFVSIVNTVKARTPKAKQEYSEWLAFIDFIKDYSYLNQRKLQELEIWDDYLTYSIAFGITDVRTLFK